MKIDMTLVEQVNNDRLIKYIRKNVRKIINAYGTKAYLSNTPDLRYGVYQKIMKVLNDMKTDCSITEFTVICDKSNNGPSVLESKHLNVDIEVPSLHLCYRAVAMADSDDSYNDLIEPEALAEDNFNRAMKGI